MYFYTYIYTYTYTHTLSHTHTFICCLKWLLWPRPITELFSILCPSSRLKLKLFATLDLSHQSHWTVLTTYGVKDSGTHWTQSDAAQTSTHPWMESRKACVRSGASHTVRGMERKLFVSTSLHASLLSMKKKKNSWTHRYWQKRTYPPVKFSSKDVQTHTHTHSHTSFWSTTELLQNCVCLTGINPVDYFNPFPSDGFLSL